METKPVCPRDTERASCYSSHLVTGMTVWCFAALIQRLLPAIINIDAVIKRQHLYAATAAPAASQRGRRSGGRSPRAREPHH